VLAKDLSALSDGKWMVRSREPVTSGVLTTAGNLVMTPKIQRAADVSPISLVPITVNANVGVAFALGSYGLANGDTFYMVANGAGLNVNTLTCERPVVGIP